MKIDESPCMRINSKLGFLLILTLMLNSSGSFAQVAVNFAGVWIQDTLKSDDFYKSFDVQYTITQTPAKFTVKQAFTLKGSNEVATDEYSYTLDGKISNWKKETGLEKNSVKWSADKKVLTTRSTITYGNEDVGFTETYSISPNNLVLTVQKSNIIEGLPSVKMIFNKKQ